MRDLFYIVPQTTFTVRLLEKKNASRDFFSLFVSIPLYAHAGQVGAWQSASIGMSSAPVLDRRIRYVLYGFVAVTISAPFRNAMCRKVARHNVIVTTSPQNAYP